MYTDNRHGDVYQLANFNYTDMRNQVMSLVATLSRGWSLVCATEKRRSICSLSPKE